MHFPMKSIISFVASFLFFSSFAVADNYVPTNTQAPGEEPVSPEEAAKLMSVPDGFSVTLFAGEPEVRQPIAMQVDDRGRIWVAESYSYKEWEMKGEDRILIFEDSDNDGRFDDRKIFYSGATHLSGFVEGFGGTWICNSPNLEFIPDRNGDDIPDGPPEIILDGFTTDGKHNFFSGLTWGPDGWLYGRHGITASSLVGIPGTPPEERVDVSCGIWRLHPVTHQFEIVARGTTNPWGLDWNEMGEMFMTGNVNGHLWHVIPGAFYPRMHGQGSAAHVYDRIPMAADHLHHEGEWTDRRNFRDNAPGLTDDMGGGHSHCGAMIYLGDNWPEKYRDTIFMSNTHGRRVNHDILKRKGSGYIGIHGKDFMKANQPWYRGVTQIYGPDGGVYFSDWTDFGECHDNDGVHRTSGRIYKVVYGEVGNPGRLDLSKKTSLELVACQLHHNEWYVRHARRLLQERFVAGANLTEAREELLRLLEDEEQPVDRQLRFLWSLHTTGGLVPEKLTQLLQHKNEHMRSWAVRLIGEGGAPNSEQFALIRNIASNGESKLARLYVASTFPRFTEAQQWTLAEDLLVDFGYTEDQNLPCMIWYALRPLVGADPVRGLELLSICRDPQVYKNIVRRIASDFDLNTELMPRLITSINAALQDGHIGIAVAGVKGIEEALNGLKGLTPPENWDLLANSQETLVSSEAAKLLPVFDQGEPMAAKDWLQLIDNQTRRNQAIRKLAAFDDPKIALTILKPYPRYLTEDKEAIINTLSSRVEYARPLLNAVENGQVPSHDISAFHARQIHNLGNQQLKETLEKVWGKLRRSPVEKQEEIASWQSKLTPERLSAANLSNGKLMFDRACASCHMIYGEGGALGPHLDGSDRKNLFYLLENLIDPSAVVPQDYRMTVITLNDGRVLSGNITEQTRHAITLAGLATVEVIPLSEVVKQEQLEQSTMPEGLLQTMSENEVTDLIAFLQQ